MGFTAVHPFIRAAERAKMAFHPAGQLEGQALLILASVPTYRTAQAHVRQSAVEVAWSVLIHSNISSRRFLM